jgi:protein-S-isoprenylcysteine O-methyltransferase Ste14
VTIEHWLQRLAVLAGMFVILTPLLGFRRARAHARGRKSGAAVNLLRWPMMLAQTVLFIVVGILLWHPLPLVLSPRLYGIVLALGSLLYFPGITLYLWGYRSIGRMFGISSGFGATLYQNHQLIRSGPYHYMRHPMYLAVILTAFGALLVFRTWTMALYAPMSLGVVFRARREEQLLAEEFGKEWETYRQEVNEWIPRFRKRVK